jgi:hypothetical protein
MALVNEAQAVISETGFTSCTSSYSKSWTLTMPSNTFANYAVIAVMTETKQHYSGTWIVDYSNKVIQQAALGVTSKVVATPQVPVAPGSFADIMTSIASFIAGIFSTLATWLHNLFGLGVVIFLS